MSSSSNLHSPSGLGNNLVEMSDPGAQAEWAGSEAKKKAGLHAQAGVQEQERININE